MNIFNKLRNDVIIAGKKICDDDKILQATNIEIPKDTLNGDLATNIAMVIASKQNINSTKEITSTSSNDEWESF